MAPSERIAAALVIWPGTVPAVAQEAGVSKSRLRTWAGLEQGRYSAPTAEDADRVEGAVRALFVARLAQLGAHAGPPEL